ncbi:unnamed protein product [marine sediment metagenome]|uniref:Uncharacterized protein n=1 Tax=marine sediment metagenome TaxID=412755 RepID=X1J7S1_9ZZZZ
MVFTYKTKTSRGGKPKVYRDLDLMLASVKLNLLEKQQGMGAGKIIIEIVPPQKLEGGNAGG